MAPLTVDQKRAVESKGNVIVSAGAGSGKTKVLTDRVIFNLLGKGGEAVKLENLLILTFTNDAALSMKTKIKKSLNENNLKDLVPFVDSAHIETFDAFSRFVVLKYGFKFGYPKNINVIEEDILQVLARTTLDELFTNEYKKKDETFLELIYNYVPKSDVRIKEFILAVYKDHLFKMQNPIEFLQNFQKTLQNPNIFEEIPENVYNRLKKKLEICTSDLSSIFSSKLANFVLSKTAQFLALGDFGDFINNKNIFDTLDTIDKNISTYIKEEYDLESEKEEIDKAIVKNFMETIKSLRNLTELNLDLYLNIDVPYQKKFLPFIIDHFLIPLILKVENFKYENGYFTFSDIAKMAINIVKGDKKENIEVREELKNQYKLIMIDEYQDTSDEQEEFINLIANDNVFSVGDIKQSIYRFRGAKPKLFESKYNRYKASDGGTAIDMNENFRSRKEVLYKINDMFINLMSSDFGGADYKKDHIIKASNTSYDEKGKNEYQHGIFILPYAGIGEKDGKLIENKDGLYELEAKKVAKNIKKRLENHQLVFDKDEGILREAKYSDFTILSYKSKSFETFEKVFKEEGIPFNAIYDEDIKEDISIVILINIFKLIKAMNETNKDEVMIKHLLFSIMRSFLFDYDDTYLYELFIEGDSYKTHEIYIKLSDLAKNYEDKPLKELFDAIIKDFNYLKSFSKLNGAINAIDKNGIFYSKVKVMDDLGYSLSDFIIYLETLTRSNTKMDQTIYSETSEAVTITTVHKSKGLEYPFVYLVNNSDFREEKLDKKGDYYVLEDGTFYLPLFSDDERKANIFSMNLIKDDSYFKEDEEERLRLLYVALTRAKEEVILVLDKEPFLNLSKIIENDERNGINYSEKRKAELKKIVKKVWKGETFFDFYKLSDLDFPLDQFEPTYYLHLKEIVKNHLSSFNEEKFNGLSPKAFNRIFSYYLITFSKYEEDFLKHIKKEKLLLVLENKKEKEVNYNFSYEVFAGAIKVKEGIYITKVLEDLNNKGTFLLKLFNEKSIILNLNNETRDRFLNALLNNETSILYKDYISDKLFIKNNDVEDFKNKVKEIPFKEKRELIINEEISQKQTRASKFRSDDAEDSTLIFGTHMHSLLEIIDFKEPDYSLIKNNYEKEKIKKVVEIVNSFDILNAKIFKEYQFKDEKSNVSGIIDLLILKDNLALIFDYKLKNIDDEAYKKQLFIYKNYVLEIFKVREIKTYLISITNGEYKEVK